jgi:uncharacterized protein
MTTRTLGLALIASTALAIGCGGHSSKGAKSTTTAPVVSPVASGVSLAPPVTASLLSPPTQVPPPTPTPPASPALTLGGSDHLLISELNYEIGSQFIEIFNPTTLAVNLGTVYLTDSVDPLARGWAEYWKLPTGRDYLTVTNDFLVRFPPTATIAPGQAITIAMHGLNFQARYGISPDYCFGHATGGSILMVSPDGQYIPPVWRQIGSDGSLSPLEEMVLMYRWDGVSDLMQDLDYVHYGTNPVWAASKVDKTGVVIDGRDAGTTASAYLPDTPAGLQSRLPDTTPTLTSLRRIDFTEGGEVHSGGNGATGHDETSEPLQFTFVASTPTPGVP